MVDMNTNVNKIDSSSFGNSKQKTSSILENLKVTYNGYVEKISKTDFANSLTRYQIQYNMLKDIKNFASQEQNEQELAFVQEQFVEISENALMFSMFSSKVLIVSAILFCILSITSKTSFVIDCCSIEEVRTSLKSIPNSFMLETSEFIFELI